MSSPKPPTPKRQVILLSALLAVLVLLVGYQVLPMLAGGSDTARTTVGSSPVPARASSRPATPRRSATGRAPSEKDIAAEAAARGEVESVHLERLQAEAPEPTDGRRNPFSLAPPPPPPSAAPKPVAGGANGGPVVAGPPQPVGPPPPPPVPPIALKFIGMVTVPTRVGTVAALSDGKFVYYGREGDVIEGRYRIVKIGEESIQIEHVDGRGRQTIRLSGK